MGGKTARITAIFLALALAAMSMFLAAAPALAQDKQGEQAEGDIPPELQDKLQELRGEAKELRSALKPLLAGARQYLLENRGSLREMRSELRENIAKRREKIRGLEEQLAPVQVVFEATRMLREALRSDFEQAWEAWGAGDLEKTLSYLDQALAKIGELTRFLKEGSQGAH